MDERTNKPTERPEPTGKGAWHGMAAWPHGPLGKRGCMRQFGLITDHLSHLASLDPLIPFPLGNLLLMFRCEHGICDMASF